MFIYTLTKANKMGEAHPDYGQTWWAEAKEGRLPIMFNTKNSYLPEGQVVVAEEQEEKTSAKGTKYLRLKKVKLAEPEAINPETAESSPKPSNYVLERVLQEMKKQTALLQKLVGEAPEASEKKLPPELDLSVPDESGDWLPEDEEEPMPEGFWDD